LIDLLHVKVDGPVLVQCIVESPLAGHHPSCSLHVGSAVINVHAGEAGVVDTSTHVGLEGTEVGEVVLGQQCRRQVL
jgi:hypothetical protein